MASSITTQKVRENRLRRMAQRQGLQLVKIRRRDPRAIDYGRFRLTSPGVATEVVLGREGDPRGVTLDEVESYLTIGPTGGEATK